ncbi:MAG: DUF4062 domain-containing protein [Acidobacteriota bacterium]
MSNEGVEQQMEKRYQVFVSSTYTDLREERQQVSQALLKLDCFPAGMELFPAANEDQWKLITKVIDDSDYYIVIVAGRYGSSGPSGIGYTQMEYEYAVSKGKPVIGFLHGDPGSIPSSKCDPSQEAKDRLANFRRIVKEKPCNHWLTPSELGLAVTISLIKLIKSTPAIGWVRGNSVPEEARLQDMLTFDHEGMQKAHHHLDDEDLQGYLENSSTIRVLKTWFPESRQIGAGLIGAIEKMGAIEKTESVRLLLCKPGSDILLERSLGAHEEEWFGSFAVSHGVKLVYNCLVARARLGKPPANVKIGIYDSWPGCPVIWYDKKILMGFYIRGKSSPSWPWINVREGSALARFLSAQWNDLWGHEKTEHLNTLEEMKNWLERPENKKWANLGVIPERISGS